MVPLLLAVLPRRRWAGPTLPPLKPWARAVFAGYLLVTVPLLAVLLVNIVRVLPSIVLTAWDSGRVLVSGTIAAGRRGDVPRLTAGALQLVFLALPLLGISLMLTTLGRTLGAALWRWSWPTPGRRGFGALVTTGLVLGVVWLWAPQVPVLARTLAVVPVLGPHLAGATPPGPAGASGSDASTTAPVAAAEVLPTATTSPPPGAVEVVAEGQAVPRDVPTGVRARTESSAGALHVVGSWQVQVVGSTPTADAPAIHGVLVTGLELFADGSYCVEAWGNARFCGRYRLVANPAEAVPAAIAQYELTESTEEFTLHGPDGQALTLHRAAAPK